MRRHERLEYMINKARVFEAFVPSQGWRGGAARGARGGQRRRGGDGGEGMQARRRVLWQETEGLRGALQENLNSIEMILAEIDGQVS